MKWGGFTSFTLSDFPGKIAAIAFTQGCNFRCPYCHNANLIRMAPTSTGSSIIPPPSTEQLLEYLKSRLGKLTGLVISGGEPTCQVKLIPFVSQVQALGLAIKLDTNGSHPNVLQTLLETRLVDYVAMDIKAPLHKYSSVARAAVSPLTIQQSIELICGSDVPSEFRLTATSPLLTKEDILQVGALIGGRRPLYLQPYTAPPALLDTTFETMPQLTHIGKHLREKFGNTFVRV